MAMAPCAECGVQVSDKAAACPQCGARPGRFRPAGNKTARVVILGVAGAFVGLTALGLFVDTSSPELDEMSEAKRMIKLCWKEQERKSLDPETARVFAGTCEQLEADYKAKYRTSP